MKFLMQGVQFTMKSEVQSAAVQQPLTGGKSQGESFEEGQKV